MKSAFHHNTYRSLAAASLVALLAALGFFLAWIRGWYLERIGGRQQNELAMIDPAELRRLRELAEARKREAATASPPQGPVPPAT